MKKLIAFMFALILVFTLVSCEDDPSSDPKTSGEDKKDGKEITFTLYNYTHITLKSISVSLADKNQWGENLIGAELKPGESSQIKINVNFELGTLQFDVLGKDNDGDSYIFNFLDLSECTEKGGNIFLLMTEGGEGYANFALPYEEPTLTIDSPPTKLKYKVGEGFDPSGFAATYTDQEGVETKITADDVEFVVSGTVVLTSGRPFQQAGKKVVEFEYMGLTAQFELIVE